MKLHTCSAKYEDQNSLIINYVKFSNDLSSHKQIGVSSRNDFESTLCKKRFSSPVVNKEIENIFFGEMNVQRAWEY